jgi:uncharacterized protein YbjT (DUF2867 family)
VSHRYPITDGELYDYAAIASELRGYDACLFCLGVSAAGLDEAAYTRITHDLTLAAARAVLAANPEITFIYVSGAGTDATERGRTMWARVKGRTENALFGLGFRRVYMFRPGFIRPLGGIKSKTRSYRILYAIFGPLTPFFRLFMPKLITDTDRVGRAMVAVARDGFERRILETVDINAIADAQKRQA